MSREYSDGCQGLGDAEDEEMLVKGHKSSVIRHTCSGDLMCCMVTVSNNAFLKLPP